jgi:hypothetical protein
VNAGSIASEIDQLYQRAVERADEVTEPVLIEWADQVAEVAGSDRDLARATRRAIRTARKLAKYWTEHDPNRLPDWHNGVDEALGGQGWQAQLDILHAALERSPDSELFDQVRERHRAVHFSEWMEGVSYEEWLESRE